MYDQTSTGREREMDVGSSYDTTSGSAAADFRDPGNTGTAYPRPEYTTTGYSPAGDTDPGSTTVETSGQATTTAARDPVQTAKEAASDIAGEVSAQARNLAGDLREQFRDRAIQQQGTMVSKLREASGEMRQMAQGRDQSPATSLVSNLAERADRLANQLESRGLDGLLSDVQEFARRRPGTFLLACTAAGFAVGRLGKSIFAGSGAGATQREYQAAFQAGSADMAAGLRASGAATTSTYATHGRGSLIHDEGGWTDLRSDTVLAPSTAAGTSARPSAGMPATPEEGRS